MHLIESIAQGVTKELSICSPLFNGQAHTSIGCGKQGFLSAQLYLSHDYGCGQNIPSPPGLQRRKVILSILIQVKRTKL